MSKKNALVNVNENQEIRIPTSAKEVPATIEGLKVRLASLKGNEDVKVSTDITYDHRNIKDITTVSDLLAISASIKARSKAFNEEVVAFGLEGKIKPFTHSEKTAEDWDLILKKAVNELINKTQIKQIEDAISKLSNHLDAETKLKNELAGLVESASGLIS